MHRDALAEQLEQFGLLLVHVALENVAGRFGGNICTLLLGQPVASRLVEIVHATLKQFEPSLEWLAAFLEALRRLGGHERQRSPGERSLREHRLHLVVVLGRDWVELVVVAPRTTKGDSEERLSDVVRHVIEEQLTRHGRHSHARVLPRAAPQEPGSDDRLWIVREQFVAGNLFKHEAIEWLVRVETANHVVAISPRIGPLEVIGIPGGVRVAGYIQPMPPPALSVTRGIQQSLH